MFAGGSFQEAEGVVSDAMTDVLGRWDSITNPQAYALRAAIRYLIKSKQRGLARTRDRLIQRGDVAPEQDLDAGLTAWEEHEWVMLLLKSLPPAQREVLAFMVDSLTGQEIAQLLGKTEAAVRQNLCAARKRLKARLTETGGREAQ